MAYRLRLEESPTNGFRRISQSLSGLALDELNASSVEAGGVHASRKAIKRLRALIRLFGPALGKAQARRFNKNLRDVGRTLSKSRDRAVVTETLARLSDAGGEEAAVTLRPLLRHLEARAAELTAPLDPDEAVRARDALSRIAKRLEKSRVKGKGFGAMRDGLESSYRTGRAALKAAQENPTNETLHELRKAVQTHWRQMSLISRAWPDVLGARVTAARQLSQILGRDHDIAVLGSVADAAADIEPGQKLAISALCEASQTRIRETALARAAMLFAEKPSAFAARMQCYWKQAREIAASRPRPTLVVAHAEVNGEPAPPIARGSAPSVLQSAMRSKAPSQRGA